MSTPFKQGLHRGRDWGDFYPPPLFCKNKINQTKKINKNNGAKNSLPTQKLAAGSLLNFYFHYLVFVSSYKLRILNEHPQSGTIPAAPPPLSPPPKKKYREEYTTMEREHIPLIDWIQGLYFRLWIEFCLLLSMANHEVQAIKPGGKNKVLLRTVQKRQQV